MSIRFSCPCGRIYEVGDHLAGKQAHCQNCGRFLIVPGTPPPPPPQPQASPEPEPPQQEAPPPRPEPQSEAQQSQPQPEPQPQPVDIPEAVQTPDGDEDVVETELVEEAPPQQEAPSPPAAEPTLQSAGPSPEPTSPDFVPTADWVDSDEPVEHFQQLESAAEAITDEDTVAATPGATQNTYTVVGVAVGDEEDPRLGKDYQVLSLGLWPLSIVGTGLGLLGGLIAAVVIVVAIVASGVETDRTPWTWLLLCPAGAVFGFLTGLVGGLIFNLLAPRVGGLEISLRKASRGDNFPTKS